MRVGVPKWVGDKQPGLLAGIHTALQQVNMVGLINDPPQQGMDATIVMSHITDHGNFTYSDF